MLSEIFYFVNAVPPPIGHIKSMYHVLLWWVCCQNNKMTIMAAMIIGLCVGYTDFYFCVLEQKKFNYTLPTHRQSPIPH